jgi:hypothetical protein
MNICPTARYSVLRPVVWIGTARMPCHASPVSTPPSECRFDTPDGESRLNLHLTCAARRPSLENTLRFTVARGTTAMAPCSQQCNAMTAAFQRRANLHRPPRSRHDVPYFRVNFDVRRWKWKWGGRPFGVEVFAGELDLTREVVPCTNRDCVQSAECRRVRDLLPIHRCGRS